jgi:hypothetical protein
MAPQLPVRYKNHGNQGYISGGESCESGKNTGCVIVCA